MKHLVISVSSDTSLGRLASLADTIQLDKDSLPSDLPRYDSLYVRSHFSRPALQPQVFRAKTDALVRSAKEQNPAITFVDAIETIDSILHFEDKWHQYQTFHELMPRTELLDDTFDVASFVNPVYKKRLSSRGAGVTWNKEEVTQPGSDWIVQESLVIREELRIYVVGGDVHQVAAVRQSKTSSQSIQVVGFRPLTPEETDFSQQASKRCSELDLIGIDIARTSDNKLKLIEVNRSPDFDTFTKLTGSNLAHTLYRKLEESISSGDK